MTRTRLLFSVTMVVELIGCELGQRSLGDLQGGTDTTTDGGDSHDDAGHDDGGTTIASADDGSFITTEGSSDASAGSDGGTITCDPFTQDCPEGEGCYFDGTGFVCAIDASGNQGGLGGVCEFINACDPGLSCTEHAITGCEGDRCCTSFCDRSAADPNAGCDEASVCTALVGDVGVCIGPVACDPLTPQCEEGEGCYYYDFVETYVCVLDASGEGGQAGTPCEFLNACDPGLMCATDVLGCAGDHCCTSYCNLDDGGTACGEGETCQPVVSDIEHPDGFGPVGVCVAE